MLNKRLSQPSALIANGPPIWERTDRLALIEYQSYTKKRFHILMCLNDALPNYLNISLIILWHATGHPANKAVLAGIRGQLIPRGNLELGHLG